MPARIWLVTVGEPLIGREERRAPLRTGSLALHLVERRHHVTWWTSGFDHFRKRHFLAHERQAAAETGVQLEFLDGVSYASNVSLARLRNHGQLGRQFRHRAALAPVPDVILVSLPTLELVREVANYANLHRVPFVVDVRDLWPDVFVWAAPPWARRAIGLATWPMRLRAARAVASAAAVVGVSDGYLAWGLGLAGRERRSADVAIPLFGRGASSGAAMENLQVAGVDFSKRLFVFGGSFGSSYDVETLVRAGTLLSRETAECAQIVVAGDGAPRRMSGLRAMAASTGVVVLPGWLDAAQLRGLYARAYCGVAAYSAGALQSLPNKFVEYLARGLPILSSLEGEAAALLEQSGAGWSYRAGDAAMLARQIDRVTADVPARDAAACAARRLHAARFEAEACLASLEECLLSVMVRRADVAV
jgi:glycosyltransferase involved in cell wall biosynthesis